MQIHTVKVNNYYYSIMDNDLTVYIAFLLSVVI